MNIRPLDSTSFPEPPPLYPGIFLPLGIRTEREPQQHMWAALKMYTDAIRMRGKPWPKWEAFERELATEFATLLLFLRALPREDTRKRLLDMFLDGLNLENKRGRRRKDRKELADHLHGQQMKQLWDNELQAAWNMKTSLKNSGTDPLPRLKKEFAPDVVAAVLSRRATAQTALAGLYAQRKHLSPGRARNALREYQKLTGEKFSAHV